MPEEPLVRTPPRILIVDDNPDNLDIFQARLAVHGYEILRATDGYEALATAKRGCPDLILLDVMMPKMDGIEVCRHLKADPGLPFIPIILVTAKADSKDVVAGLEAGGDEYLTKPLDQAALVARVKSMLRIKALHDTAQDQAARLEAQAAQLAEWNRTLERRVGEQVAELERIGRLKRFLSPQLAEVILSAGDEKLLESHRREITTVFCDLRGFTAFAETAEPEEVMGVLREYHAAMGALIFQFEGTLERFAGDGLMVFFNDPIPCPEPEQRAVQMAVAMRQRATELVGTWRKRGHQLDFGVGIATGYATLGKIGFEGRFDYGAIGTVTNLASRLCGEAKGGQILVSQRVHAAVEELVDAEPVGEVALKGFHRPVGTYSVLGLKG
jgi:adenylate cyclase